MSEKIVMVVEDEEKMREMIVDAVSLKYKAVPVGECEKLFEIFREINPDVVLLDIFMPGMDGLEALQKMHTMDKDVVAIMVTALSDVETAVKTAKAGAFDYITKPFKIAELLSKIEKALAQRERNKKWSEIEIALESGYRAASQDIQDKIDEIFAGRKTEAEPPALEVFAKILKGA